MLAPHEIEKLGDRLKALCRDGGSIEAAQVRLIGLDEIREAAGPRWPRMRERVRSGSLSLLTHHTGPDEVVIPCGDGFLIILANETPGVAQRRCNAMREALIGFYLGQDALCTLRAEVTNRTFSADGLTDLLATSMPKRASGDLKPALAIPKGRNGAIARVPVSAAHEYKLGAKMCAPVLFEHGTQRLGYNPEFILDGKHTRADFLELDIALLDEALGAATDAKAAGRPIVLGFSVHATTLQLRRARETYLSWLADVDPETRRYLFIAIAEIEKGTPLISISEWVSALRLHLGRVWLNLHYTDHAIGALASTGAWAAGFHLPVFAGAQKAPRSQRMLEQVGFWTKTLHGQGLRVAIDGFQDEAFLAAAETLGVDFATGDKLWPFVFPHDADEIRVMHASQHGAAQDGAPQHEAGHALGAAG